MSQVSPALLAQFVRDLALLALPAADQTAALKTFGTWPSLDELALSFGDGVLLLPQFVEQCWVSEGFASAVKEIDVIFDELSGEKSSWFWEAEALENSVEWRGIRSYALRALLSLE